MVDTQFEHLKSACFSSSCPSSPLNFNRTSRLKSNGFFHPWPSHIGICPLPTEWWVIWGKAKVESAGPGFASAPVSGFVCFFVSCVGSGYRRGDFEQFRQHLHRSFFRLRIASVQIKVSHTTMLISSCSRMHSAGILPSPRYGSVFREENGARTNARASRCDCMRVFFIKARLYRNAPTPHFRERVALITGARFHSSIMCARTRVLSPPSSP